MLAAATLVALLALAGTASALTQRGFAFAGSFGTPGSGSGQLNSPEGVAVSAKSGDIYVVDAGNNRIDRFTSAGAFIEAWGWGVQNAAKELQTCTTECKAGLAGHGKGQLFRAEAIAIDNDSESPSYGDVYVENVTYHEEPGEEFEFGLVTKYDENGSVIKAVGGHWEELWGLTVTPEGHLLVYAEEELEEYDGEVSNKQLYKEVSPELDIGKGREPRPLQIAADSHSDVYLGNATGGPTSPTTVGKVLILEEPIEKGKVEKFGAPVIEALDGESSTGVAVDPATEGVIVDHSTSLAEFDAEGNLVQRFGDEVEGTLQGGAGVTTRPSASVSGSSEVLVADSAAGRIELFAPSGAGGPAIDAVAAVGANVSSVQLTASIDPNGSAGETEYRYRYSTGPVPVAGEACTGACVEAPVPAGKLPGSAGHFGDLTVPVLELTGLAESTVYHFRLIASNALGTVESRELKFKTRLPEALPDGRHLALVSPPDKNGGFIDAMPLEGGDDQASTSGSAVTYNSTAATSGSEGNRAPDTDQLLSVRREGAAGAPEWATTNLQTPVEQPFGFSTNSGNEYRSFSPDLGLAIVSPFGQAQFEHPALTPEATERTIYQRHNFSCTSPTTCYTPLVTASNVSGETETGGVKEKSKFGAFILFRGADESDEHVVVSSSVPLTSEKLTSEQNLYVWSEGQLHLVSELPGGGTAFGQLGSRGLSQRNAVSADGSRVVWSAEPALYVRFVGLHKTLRIDEAAAGAGEPGETGPAVFQAADPGDNEIFFTAQRRLTTDSTAAREKPDLYVCQVQHASTEPSCLLRDLSVDSNAGESAFVQEVIPGLSSDGSELFFVANGALSEGAPSGNCVQRQKRNNQGGEEVREVLAGVCNLYVEHRAGGAETGAWSSPQLIATLSAEDEPDWGGGGTGNLRYLSDRVSPNGEWFSFMSSRSLTGYDNRDAVSGRRDEEVYLYNTVEKSLVCASCDPSGARPHGIEDKEESGEGLGMLVDRREVWGNSWLAASLPTWPGVDAFHGTYQPRYLTDNGRLFFNTSQQLAPQDQNHTQDVYEYEPDGSTGPGGATACSTALGDFDEEAGGCVALISGGTPLEKESAFLDSGESGEDVFFDTAAQLTTGDPDQSYDVYDAEVCGIAGAHACVPEPALAETSCGSLAACRGGETAPTIPSGGAGTLAPSGSGNSSRVEVLSSKTEEKPKPKPKPLTRAQKYAKALKACKKLKHKHKRAACVAHAKKLYGPKKKHAAKKAAHSTAAPGARR